MWPSQNLHTTLTAPPLWCQAWMVRTVPSYCLNCWYYDAKFSYSGFWAPHRSRRTLPLWHCPTGFGEPLFSRFPNFNLGPPHLKNFVLINSPLSITRYYQLRQCGPCPLPAHIYLVIFIQSVGSFTQYRLLTQYTVFYCWIRHVPSTSHTTHILKAESGSALDTISSAHSRSGFFFLVYI